MKKIYGFALSKTRNVDQAEELASIITFDVYKSLLKVDEVMVLNKYIYRIASNVYARFVEQEMNKNSVSKRDILLASIPPPSNDRAYALIRSEIAYLGKLQREIIVMHYYQKLKLKEIAQKLGLPLGTVGWHLNEARNQIGEGFKDQNSKSSIRSQNDSKQIDFREMKTSGQYGPLYTDMSFYFSFGFSRNIAYSAFRNAKSSTEIATDLQIPTAFVEDEIAHLTDTGFMKKMPGQRYVTNIYLDEPNPQRDEKISQIMSKYAQIFCDIYMPMLAKHCDTAFGSTKIKNRVTLPGNDKNFLIWNIITYACFKQLKMIDYKNDRTKYYIKRKDGGHNIALATINDDLDSGDRPNPLNADLSVSSWHRDAYPVNIWSYFSQYDDRQGKYKDYGAPIFTALYDFIVGRISKELIHIEKYISLFEKGLLVTRGNTEFVNMLVMNMTQNEVMAIFPPIPENVKDIAKELDETLYHALKSYYPSHIHDLCQSFSQNTLSGGKMRAFILQNMLQKGILKPLKKNQRKTVNMIMFVEN